MRVPLFQCSIERSLQNSKRLCADDALVADLKLGPRTDARGLRGLVIGFDYSTVGLGIEAGGKGGPLKTARTGQHFEVGPGVIAEELALAFIQRQAHFPETALVGRTFGSLGHQARRRTELQQMAIDQTDLSIADVPFDQLWLSFQHVERTRTSQKIGVHDQIDRRRCLTEGMVPCSGASLRKTSVQLCDDSRDSAGCCRRRSAGRGHCCCQLACSSTTTGEPQAQHAKQQYPRPGHSCHHSSVFRRWVICCIAKRALPRFASGSSPSTAK